MDKDKYGTFQDLLAQEAEGTDFRLRAVNRGSAVAIIAPHGGGIEPGTSEIAEAVAADSLSLYVFEGCKPTDNGDLHITSTKFDEPEGIKLVTSAKSVIAIHGEKSAVAAVFNGGRDEARAVLIERALQTAGFTTARHKNPGLQGTSANNICNRGTTGAGVQLEISRGLREKLFKSLNREGRKQPTARLADLVAAIRSALV